MRAVSVLIARTLARSLFVAFFTVATDDEEDGAECRIGQPQGTTRNRSLWGVKFAKTRTQAEKIRTRMREPKFIDTN